MKAINDYRILMPNVPYYETGILFNEFEIVYYTGINAGTYTDSSVSWPGQGSVISAFNREGNVSIYWGYRI